MQGYKYIESTVSEVFALIARDVDTLSKRDIILQTQSNQV